MARGPRTKGSGEIVKHRDKSEQAISPLDDALMRRKQLFVEALPSHVDPERMIRVLRTAIRTTPKLSQCDPYSALLCMTQCAQLGLEPNTPLNHAALIPRSKWKKDGGRWVEVGIECTMIIQYQGFIELAYRSGRVHDISAHVVRKGDIYRVKLGTTQEITHEPSDKDDRHDQPMTHAYSVALLDTGRWSFRQLNRAQVLSRRDRSENVKAARRKKFMTPWDTDEEEMWMKTAVRAHWKYLPKSAERTALAIATSVDEAAERGRSLPQAVDPMALNVANEIAAVEGLALPEAADSTPEAEFIDETANPHSEPHDAYQDDEPPADVALPYQDEAQA